MRKLWNRVAGPHVMGTVVRMGLIFLVTILMCYVVILNNLRHSYQHLQAICTVSHQINEFDKTMVHEQMSEKGYALSGLHQFLTDYLQDERTLETQIRTLKTESVLTPSSHQLLLRMIASSEDWHLHYANLLIEKRRRGQPVSSSEVLAAQAAFNRFGALDSPLDRAVPKDGDSVQRDLFRRTLWTMTTFVFLLILVGWVNIFTIQGDLNRRRKMEETLRETQASLSQAQRIARVGSWEWEIIRNEYTWSEEMHQIFGVQRGNFPGTHEAVLMMVHPDDLDRVLMATQLAFMGQPYDVEYRIVRPDGSVRDVHMLGEAVFNEEGLAVRMVGAVQDITERKQTEEMLLKSEKLSAVGQLAAGVAHEVRNPLTALKGFMQLLPTVTPDTQQRYISIMKDEINRIEFIVSELLVMSKPQAVRYTFRDLQQTLSEVITLLNTQAIMHNVEIVTDMSSELPMVECADNQLKQVFVNVIKNAIEAMPQGGELHISATTSEQSVIISIRDTGEGIPEERIPRIGEPFYTTKEKGTGLGLMVTNKIVENHHGSFHIESAEGQGTTVTIKIPISQPK